MNISINFLYTILTIVFVINLERCHSAKILFAQIIITQSHVDAVEPIARQLVEKHNHQVTIVSPLIFRNPHPNITYVSPQAIVDLLRQLYAKGGDAIKDRVKNKHSNILFGSQLLDVSFLLCKTWYKNPEFQRFAKESHFDIVIYAGFGRECFYPVVHLWKAKFVIFSVAPLVYGERDAFGLPLEGGWLASWKSHWLLPSGFVNDWEEFKWHLWRQYRYLPRFDQLAKEELGWLGDSKEIPPVSQLERNTSMYLLNTHYSSEPPPSLPPFVVQVSGLNCKKTNGISDSKLRSFVEDPSSIGFIYLSWGSALKISTLPPEQQQILWDTMRRFKKLKFVLRWEGEVPESAPKNVFVSTWFKQQEILGHPRCRGFVTHGGIMSFQQAVYHGVPVIVVPFAMDQLYHASNAEKLGVGIHMEISQMTVDSLYKAITQLVKDKGYRARALEQSKLSKDRPIPPVELAVWWINFVLRHDPRLLDNLKSPAVYKGMLARRHGAIWLQLFILLLLGLLVAFLLSTRLLARRRAAHQKENDTVVDQEDEKKGQ